MDLVIERCYEECCAILEVVEHHGDMSLNNAAEVIFQKYFAICVASHFEKELCDSLELYYQDVSGEHTPAVCFMKNKAIERQYHTWFNWDGKNANTFFALFGNEFKNYMKAKLEKDALLDEAVKSFLELGRNRNVFVHNDLGTVSSDKTMEEIYQEYCRACAFIELFPNVLHEYVRFTVEQECDKSN